MFRKLWPNQQLLSVISRSNIKIGLFGRLFSQRSITDKRKNNTKIEEKPNKLDEQNEAVKADLEREKMYIMRTINKNKSERETLIRRTTGGSFTNKFFAFFSGKQSQYAISAEFIYKATKQHVDSNALLFSKLCNFDKEFAAWFALMSYHLWFLSVRMRYEQDGGVLHQAVFDLFWSEFVDRLHDEVGNPIIVSRYKQSARDQYHGMWISLDHAMLSGDVVLANSLHRNFFAYGRGVNAQTIDAFVQYTHRTLLCLDYHPGSALFTGLICWPKLPESFSNIVLSTETDERDLKSIYKPIVARGFNELE